MNPTAIFHPMLALVAWTFVVLFMIPRRRFRAAREKLVRVADFAYGESANVPGEVRLPSRNLANLFETPVLFYVACLTLFVTAKVDVVAVGLAWAYVAARIAHSLVHVSYNNVMHRMRAFVVGIALLMALWVRIAIALF
jgi:hypothetical protein